MEIERLYKVPEQWIRIFEYDQCKYDLIMHVEKICNIVDSKIIIDDNVLLGEINKLKNEEFGVDGNIFLVYYKYFIVLGGNNYCQKYFGQWDYFSLNEWMIKELLE